MRLNIPLGDAWRVECNSLSTSYPLRVLLLLQIWCFFHSSTSTGKLTGINCGWGFDELFSSIHKKEYGSDVVGHGQQYRRMV